MQIMNSLLLSFESNDRCDYNFKGPNQFCLQLFNNQSCEDSNNQFFKNNISDKQAQNPLQKCEKPFSQNFSNYFQFQQLSQHSSKQEFLFEDLNLECQLDQFIEKPKIERQDNSSKQKRVIPAIRDYKKNICRNIIRYAIRALESRQSRQFLKNYLSETQLEHFSNYFISRLEQLSGFRILKDNIIVKSSDNLEVQQRKQVFNKYLSWFVEQRSSIYILQGEANNIGEYLKYKNEVLTYYLRNPGKWHSNKPLWKSVKQEQKHKKKRIRKSKKNKEKNKKQE